MHANIISNIASGIRTLFSSGHGMNGHSTAENEFWQRKMLTHFSRMDINGDGFVCRNDFKSTVKLLTSKGKLSEQTAFLIQRLVIQLWEDFWCCGEDKGFDYQVPPEEFVELMANLLKLSDCKKLLEEPLGLLFGVVDMDGSGVVNLKKWTIYNEAIGISAADAKHSFEVCFDQKSEISKADFIAVGQVFFTSVDEKHCIDH